MSYSTDDDLRQWLLFADEGQLKKSQLQDQANQASALTLVNNAIIVRNTVYMQAVIDQLKQEGYSINESDLPHISPCRFEHINKHGKLTFNVDTTWRREFLRPLTALSRIIHNGRDIPVCESLNLPTISSSALRRFPSRTQPMKIPLSPPCMPCGRRAIHTGAAHRQAPGG